MRKILSQTSTALHMPANLLSLPVLFTGVLNKKAVSVHSDRHNHQYIIVVDEVSTRYSKKIGQEILLFLQRIASTEKAEQPEPDFEEKTKRESYIEDV